MKDQKVMNALKAENAKFKSQLKEIKSIVDAKEITEQTNDGPVKILTGLEDKAVRLEHIENTFDQFEDQGSDRSHIN